MADWDEIRLLAADLQRAQLSGTTQKLSERNCIEIVSKLLELKIIEVIFTNDGKEYLTPQQLVREIRDELYLNRGRVSIVDLAQSLNVDFSHVELQAQTVAKGDSVHIVLGQLVDSSYLDSVAEEINEKLQQEGTISISQITKDYDLPSEFLLEEIIKRLGSIIEGFQDEDDPKVILTPSFVSRNRAKIRGVLSAITKPTSVLTIINQHQFQERLFFVLANELIKVGRIPGVISGGKKASKATYIPHSYAKAQSSWADNFYNQNSYVEYDALSRLGISSPMDYVKKRYKDAICLSTCCIGQVIRDQIEAAIDDALATGGWVDVMTLLPSILDDEDAGQLVQMILVEKKDTLMARDVQTFCNTVVMSHQLLENIAKPFDELMRTKAEKEVASGHYAKVMSDKQAKMDLSEEKAQDKKEERRKKAAGGKAGGGAQGRETKTKSTKKKGGKKRDDAWDSDEEPSKGKASSKSVESLMFMTQSEVEEKLQEVPSLQECPEDLFAEVTQHIYPVMCKKYQAVLSEIFQSSMAAAMQGKRKSHGDLQEKCNSILSSIRLFEKGIACFQNEDTKQQLEKYLLKTLGQDIVNQVLVFVMEDNGTTPSFTKDPTPEQRVKAIGCLPKEPAECLLRMHKAVVGSSVEEFVAAVEDNISQACGATIRKPDKKRDRQVLFNHRQSLLEQLGSCDDPALTLHLSLLVSFQMITSQMLHASGKFVPQILQQISDKLTEEQIELYTSYQKLVVHLLSTKDEDEKAVTNLELEQKTRSVKEIPMTLKKNTTNE